MITIQEALEAKGITANEVEAVVYQMNGCNEFGVPVTMYVCMCCKESFEEELFNYVTLCPACDELHTQATHEQRPFEAPGVYPTVPGFIVTDNDDLPF